MQIQGVRIPLVLMFFALGLAALLGLGQLYRYSRVDQPLIKFYKARSDVRDFKVSAREGHIELTVKLGPVANLRETYTALEKGTQEILDAQPFAIRIQDNRNDRLVDDYYKLHLTLQEGLATGQFSDMATRLQEQAKRLGLDEAKVFLDTQYLYVQLRRGNHYLYELLPRADARYGVGALQVRGLSR